MSKAGSDDQRVSPLYSEGPRLADIDPARTTCADDDDGFFSALGPCSPMFRRVREVSSIGDQKAADDWTALSGQDNGARENPHTLSEEPFSHVHR